MDEKYLEQASELTDFLVNAGISKSQIRQTRPKGFDGACSCGTEIPVARVTAGYYNCVSCQERIERHNKNYRGVG